MGNRAILVTLLLQLSKAKGELGLVGCKGVGLSDEVSGARGGSKVQQSYIESCIPKESCKNELNTMDKPHRVRDLYSSDHATAVTGSHLQRRLGL